MYNSKSFESVKISRRPQSFLKYSTNNIVCNLVIYLQRQVLVSNESIKQSECSINGRSFWDFISLCFIGIWHAPRNFIFPHLGRLLSDGFLSAFCWRYDKHKSIFLAFLPYVSATKCYTNICPEHHKPNIPTQFLLSVFLLLFFL